MMSTGAVGSNQRKYISEGKKHRTLQPRPYLEMFACGLRPGWTSWGDRANEDYKPAWPTYQNNSGRETFDKEKATACFKSDADMNKQRN